MTNAENILGGRDKKTFCHMQTGFYDTYMYIVRVYVRTDKYKKVENDKLINYTD